MDGSNSLEVVRNMKNMCLFTATLSPLVAVGVIQSNIVEVLGLPVTLFFVVILLCFSGYSMKQYKLWAENETRLLEEVQSSVPEVGGVE